MTIGDAVVLHAGKAQNATLEIVTVAPQQVEIRNIYPSTRVSRIVEIAFPIFMFVFPPFVAVMLALAAPMHTWWLVLIVIAIQFPLVRRTNVTIDFDQRTIVRRTSILGMLPLWARWRFVEDDDVIAIFKNRIDRQHRNRIVHKIGLVRGRSRFVIATLLRFDGDCCQPHLIEVSNYLAAMLRVKCEGYVTQTRFFWM